MNKDQPISLNRIETGWTIDPIIVLAFSKFVSCHHDEYLNLDKQELLKHPKDDCGSS